MTSGLWAAAILVVVIVAGYLTWPYWSPYVEAYLPTPQQDQQLAALENRIAGLEQTIRESSPQQESITALTKESETLRGELSALLQRLDKVESAAPATAGQTPDSSATDELGQQIAQLQAEMAQMQTELGGLPALQQQVSALEQRDTDAGRGDAAAMALSLNQLTEAVGTASPYAEALGAFESSAGETVADDESLTTLREHAPSGVPTVADLYQTFSATAEAVERASTELEGEGPLETTYNRLRSLVSVRRTGEAALEAGGVDATLSQARKRLQAGDLAGAVDALANLEGPAAEAAAGWIDNARARLAVNRAMARLRLVAITQLSAREG